ncbi:MAG: prepilin-type N-terminal cleavage/methylation domain-containing protein [Patescibacteria group bacterium]
MNQSKLQGKRNRFKAGLSLIELLIVVTILSLLIIGGLRGYFLHLVKARDATRKDDLNRLKVVFTEYLGDYGCFPTFDTLENCGGDELIPYLDSIPCDPVGQAPYYLDVDPAVTCPRQYRVLATLEMKSDPVITSLHCDGAEGCGGTGLESYNYGVADGVPVGNVDYLGREGGGVSPTTPPAPTSPPVPGLPTPTPVPTSTPIPVLPTVTPAPTVAPVPTSTPAPTITPPSGPYTHCCPTGSTQCNSYNPGGGGICDGIPYVDLESCRIDNNGCS